MRILCYGDSNTHGTPPMPELDAKSGRYDASTRWPRVLADMLGAGYEVVEEGQPGRTTVHDDPIEGAHRNGLTMLPAVLESHAPLDLVVLKLGTNDLKQRFSLTTLDVALGVRRLVRCCRAFLPDTRILLVAPPPVIEVGCLAEIFRGAATRSGDLGDAMARIARAEGVAFLDAGRHIAVDPLDGVHYSAETHRLLAEAIAGAVRRALA